MHFIYTVSQNKTRHYNIVHNFAKCWPIFKLLSLTDSLVNLQQNLDYLFHHTLIALLHYLVKYQSSKNAMIKTWVYESTCRAKFSHSEQLLKFLTVILLKDTQSGHIKIHTVWLYASAATQNKRYCSKMLLHMISGRLVTYVHRFLKLFHQQTQQ